MGPALTKTTTCEGVDCSGCGVRGPPSNEVEPPFEACINKPEFHTRCYWYKTTVRTTVSLHAGVGASAEVLAGVSAGVNVDIKKGTKLILYNRLVSQPGKYFCNLCFRKEFPVIAESVAFELCPKYRVKFVTPKGHLLDEQWANY